MHMCIYMQFPRNKSMAFIKFSNAFRRNPKRKKKKIKAHCLKLKPRSALRPVLLLLLLSPGESIDFLKLYKSQHWDMVPTATSKSFLTHDIVACCSFQKHCLAWTSFSFSFAKIFLVYNSESPSLFQVLPLFQESRASMNNISRSGPQAFLYFPNFISYHSNSMTHVPWMGPVPLSSLEIFMADFLNLNIII